MSSPVRARPGLRRSARVAHRPEGAKETDVETSAPAETRARKRTSSRNTKPSQPIADAQEDEQPRQPPRPKAQPLNAKLEHQPKRQRAVEDQVATTDGPQAGEASLDAHPADGGGMALVAGWGAVKAECGAAAAGARAPRSRRQQAREVAAGEPAGGDAPPAACEDGGTCGNMEGAAAAADAGDSAAEAAPRASKRARVPPGAGRRVAAGGGIAAGAKSGPSRDMELQLLAKGFTAVGGADEAGRGPLAGPVVAAVVVLPPLSDASWSPPPGLNDSKVLSEEEREAIYDSLTTDPRVKWAVTVIDHQEIDRINILQAALAAMQRSAIKLISTAAGVASAAGPAGTQQAGPANSAAAEGAAGSEQGGSDGDGAARPPLDFLLVDGNKLPKDLPVSARAVVKGDASCSCIAAASCIAKVTRDRLMLRLDEQYPQYGFAQHKGYGVPAHMEAIRTHGPCAVHRRSFEPIKSMTGWSREAMLAREAELNELERLGRQNKERQQQQGQQQQEEEEKEKGHSGKATVEVTAELHSEAAKEEEAEEEEAEDVPALAKRRRPSRQGSTRTAARSQPTAVGGRGKSRGSAKSK